MNLVYVGKRLFHDNLLIPFTLALFLIPFCNSFSLDMEIESSLNSVSIEVSLSNNYKLEDAVIDGNYVSRVVIPDTGVEGNIGYPELPVVRRLIEVPLNVDEVFYTIESWEYYPSEKLRHILCPVQPPWEKIVGKSKPPFTKLDSAYLSGKVYGSEMVSISYFGIVRGRKLFELRVLPLLYDTTDNTIKVLKSLKINIHWAIPKSLKLREPKYYSSYVDALWDKIIINEDVFRPLEKSQYNVPTGLLVITTSTLRNASELPNWVAWKTQRGFLVTVETTTNIGSTNTAIKQYIKNAYENWAIPPTFVVLLGDHPSVPTFQGTAYNNPPTDLYYSTVDGEEYYTPDLWVGRISVADATQVSRYLQKVISYEKVMWSIPENWYLKASFMAGVDNYGITEGTHNYVIEGFFEPNGFNSQRLYVTSYGATTIDVINAVNQGRGWLVYSGHGSDSSWQDGPVLTQDNVRSLTNTVYPWVLSFACDTGKFSVTECFGETWLRSTGGGIGFLGSSVTSYWDEDDILEKKICNSYFSGYTWAAGMILSGKLGFFNYYGNTDTTKRYFEMYNLLGDPTIEVWKGEIVEPQVIYPSRVSPSGGAFQIYVDRSDAIASISNSNVLFGAIRTVVGNNIIQVSPLGSIASVVLSVTGNPIKPFQTILPVLADSNAILMWDKDLYGLNSTPQILLSDADISGLGSISINVTSSTGDVEEIILVETSPQGNFIGVVNITPEMTGNNDGYLSVVHNGQITAHYYDEFVEGESQHDKYASAQIDLEPPQILTLNVFPTKNSAEIDVETSEVCSAKVGYGTSCMTIMPYEQSSGSLSSSHKIVLLNLSANTEYAYKLTLEDIAGNIYTSNCEYFRTQRIPDYFTHVYSSDIVDVVPISYHRVYFIPDNSEDFYRGYIEDVLFFPRDTQNQTLVTLGDDAFQYIEFPLGTNVLLYGLSYGGCYIGSNGFITFLQGDNSYNETPERHFSQPRVSLFFDDLNPSLGGSIGYQFWPDAFVVTFSGVPRYGGYGSVNVQLEMFYDGRISITWLRCESGSFIAGLSRGDGFPSDFVSSDFLSYPPYSSFEGEGSIEGYLEGNGEGNVEGYVEGEGISEGQIEGEGMQEGSFEGDGTNEGLVEGYPEGEGQIEGEIEGIFEGEVEYYYSADTNRDLRIDLSELLRVIQFFNFNGYHCDASTEDGYAPGFEGDKTCLHHSSDYNPPDWIISLSELLRCIQIFNVGRYYPCDYGEDGFCLG